MLVVFWLITLFVTLIVHDSATQVMMLDNFNSIEQCDVMCATAFADSKASSVACITFSLSLFSANTYIHMYVIQFLVIFAPL